MAASIRHSLGNTKNWIRYYWKALVVAVLLVAAVSGFVFARTPTDRPHGFVTDIMMDSITYSIGMDSLLDKLHIEISDDFSAAKVYGIDIPNAGTFLCTIYNVCVGVAICFVCITFFTGLMNIRATELTEEMVYRKLILFVISILMCANAHKVASWICNLGTAITEKVAVNYTTTSTALDVVEDIKDAMYYSTHTATYFWDDVPDSAKPYANKADFETKVPEEGTLSWGLQQLGTAIAGGPIGTMLVAHDVWSSLTGHMDWKTTVGHIFVNMGNTFSYVVELLFPFVISYVARIIIYFTVASRGIEMLLMCAFSPLMFMDSSSLEDFTHSSAWRFIKNMFAISIQGAIIIGIMIVGGAMMTSVLAQSVSATGFVDTMSDTGLSAVTLIIISLTEAGMCMRSGQIAKTIVSAG